jgi:hypothetical protein
MKHPVEMAKPGHLATSGPVLLPRSVAQQRRIGTALATNRKLANLPTPALNWKTSK